MRLVRRVVRWNQSILSKRNLSKNTKEWIPSSVVRHGVGDGVIVLDVGGKEFKTLRSTIESNKVLSEIVRKAESNSVLTNKGAVFIDRDPTHFGLILQHLRNKTDGLSHQRVGKFFPGSDITVELPKNKEALREIYFEAMYYGVEELKITACGKSYVTWFFGSLMNHANPFDSAKKLLARLRATLAATVGLIGVSNVNAIIDTFPDSVKEVALSQTAAFLESSNISDEEQNGKKM